VAGYLLDKFFAPVTAAILFGGSRNVKKFELIENASDLEGCEQRVNVTLRTNLFFS